MSDFLAPLKAAVMRKRWHWDVVASGSRHQAYERFIRAWRDASNRDCLVLLVDAEEAYMGPDRRLHLGAQDNWDLSGVPEEHVHLMVQAIEAWMIADADMLETFYGAGFQRSALPARRNLEEEAKDRCLDSLRSASRNTQKGAYHKTRHGPLLLGRLSPVLVRRRCPHAEILFTTAARLIG